MWCRTSGSFLYVACWQNQSRFDLPLLRLQAKMIFYWVPLWKISFRSLDAWLDWWRVHCSVYGTIIQPRVLILSFNLRIDFVYRHRHFTSILCRYAGPTVQLIQWSNPRFSKVWLQSRFHNYCKLKPTSSEFCVCVCLAAVSKLFFICLPFRPRLFPRIH